jgi:hypothetical protein
MNFGNAILALKSGKRVARSGWNGKGMFLILVPSTKPVITEGSPYFEMAQLRGKAVIAPHIDMYTAAGEMQPGWLASQADILSEDWEIK